MLLRNLKWIATVKEYYSEYVSCEVCEAKKQHSEYERFIK